MGHRFDPANFAKLEDPDRLGWQPPDVVVGLLGLTGGETVVDYGAGTGVYTLAIAAALPRGRVVAVDLSRDLLDILREQADAGLAARVEIVHDEATIVPLPDGAADAVLAVNVWHELYDETPALTEIEAPARPRRPPAIIDWARVRAPRRTARRPRTLDGATRHRDVDGPARDRGRASGRPLPYHYALVAGEVAAL